MQTGVEDLYDAPSTTGRENPKGVSLNEVFLTVLLAKGTIAND